jgi:hypothetical protein
MDYFSMSATLCHEVGHTFDIIVADLYQHKYLRVPDANELKAICHLHKEAHGVDGMVDCSTAHTHIGKIAQRPGKDPSKERKESQLLFWRHCATIICSFGMHPMGMQVV